jgi:CMP-N-acetylneuraminic acid synthetase
MVVSVKAKENPYFNLLKTNRFFDRSKRGIFKDDKNVSWCFAYNGSMYLMNAMFWKVQSPSLKKIKKIIMPEERSVDIDTMADWVWVLF